MAKDIQDLLLQGLNSNPKYIDISCRYDNDGSRYDEECGYMEEYYYYRAEENLICEFARDVVSKLNIPFKVFDLGCGSTKRSQMFLNEILRREASVEYSPNDVSIDYLEKICENLIAIYGNRLNVDPMAGDFMAVLPEIGKYPGQKLLLWLGGLQCFPKVLQRIMLSSISSTLKENDACLISTDITQDREKIEKAYMDFDESKPFAKLYTNGVHVINRDLRSNIDLSKFKLEGKYVEDKDICSASYIQVWLRSLAKQSYVLENPKKTVKFEEGEKLFLYRDNGMSHKYTFQQLKHLFASVHLQIVNKWDNEHSVLLLVKREK